jgi:hypothetical protein
MQPHLNQVYIEANSEQSSFFSSSRTKLQRTELVAQQKVLFCASALCRADEHGSKSELARRFEISRPTVYSAIDTATSVLFEYFAAQKSKAVTVQVDEAQIRRTVVALRLMAPVALRPIESLIPIVYPGVHISYGKIQQIVSEAEHRAREFNSKMDLSQCKSAALDEMFSQGEPVVAGVDLDSGALFALALRKSRSAQDWAEVLEGCKQQNLSLQTVVKDAAWGIEAAVSQVYPEAQQRDDCFHAQYQMGKVRSWLERRAYGAIGREQHARDKLETLRSTGRGKRRSKLIGELVVAKRYCRRVMQLYDTFDKAMQMAQEAMQIVDIKAVRLRTAEQSQAAIEQAASIMMGLDERKCRRVGKYLRNRAPGLVKYMVALQQQLGQLANDCSQTVVSAACVFWRLVHELRQKRFGCVLKYRRHQRHLLDTYALLCELTRSQADREALLGAVDAIFARRHRASSAIEGFNAALRPFLYVHKGVSQGFLELFRAYYNLRTRRWGRHKGTSAYQCLTGKRIDDWLSVLGYPQKAASN